MSTLLSGLRAKSLLALLVACLVALLPAGFIGWQLFDGVRNHFGEAFARNHALLNRERILAPISRELALSRRLAHSVLLRQWLRDEANAGKHRQAFLEAEGYRSDFRDQNYFLISHLSHRYYLNDREKPYSEQPRYVLQPGRADDAWFFNTMAETEDYNINVNPDLKLGVTRVWINAIVRDDRRKIGLAGTGLDLSGFLRDFVATREPGVTPMIVDRAGAIQAHPDVRLIAFGSGAGAASSPRTLDSLVATAEVPALKAALTRAEATGGVQTAWVSLDGRRQLLAIAYIPELRWHSLTAVDLAAARIVEAAWLHSALAALVALLVLLLVAYAYAVDRLVLRPLRALRQSAMALAKGDYRVELPPPGRDELGDLTQAFGSMAGRIQAHTEELEDKVRARTLALEQANRDMAASQKKISDSIDYASLIQRALLPDGQLRERLGPHHFVLWRPRDVVGGDFYLFRDGGPRYLVGVVDCAGHGVPGALMTMLARAAFDDAMDRIGIASPAALLTHADGTLRALLRESELPRGIATYMDAGLARVDREARTLRYAGAKIALYWSDGETIGEVRGERRALGHRRVGQYHDHELALEPGRTYYLVTDGFLDQAGGEAGHSLGASRFVDLLRRHAALPMAEQAEALDRALQAYRGPHAQRDDVTVLAFRID